VLVKHNNTNIVFPFIPFTFLITHILPYTTTHSVSNQMAGLENEDMTPTLRQLWTAIKQMQLDMSQIKLQINEERALRADLQQLLMQHLETSSVSSGANTPKC